MIGFSRTVAPMLGACLFATPVLAQDFATPSPAPSTASPNTGLTPAETVWHMRAALNVAALACRGPDGEETVQRYDTMLKNDEGPLAEAAAGNDRAFKARFAGHWQDAEDSAMTRLYNAFASANGHDAFCATAYDVLRAVAIVEPSNFQNFAPPRATEPIIASVSAPPQMAQLGDEVTGGEQPSVVTVAYAEPRP